MHRTESFDTNERSRHFRVAALLILGASLLLLALAFGDLLLKVRGALAAGHVSFFEIFPVNHPQFHENFWWRMRATFQPSAIFHYLTTFPSAMLTIAAALAGFFLYRARRARTSLGLSILLAVSPAVVGLALFPLTLRGMMRSVKELAEQGLLHPGAQASGIGLATAMVTLGVLLSLPCLLLMTWTRRRGPLLEKPESA